MAKACFVLLADTDTHEAMGRMTNALTSTKGFLDAGDDAVLLFDGAGTKWVPELENEDHRYHRIYAELGDHIAGACSYCAHGVRGQGADRVQQRQAAIRLSRPPEHARLRGRRLPGDHVLTRGRS